MSTKKRKMRSYKWLVALVLTVCVFGLVQSAGATEFWSESGDVLSPIDGNDCVDANNFTATDDVEAALFHTTGCTASGTKAVAFGDSTTASGDYSAAFGVKTKARGAGSLAIGYSTNTSAEIDANGIGSLAMGYAGGTSPYGDIKAWGDGSVAAGYCISDSNIYAEGKGSIALGDANGTADILSTGNGSFAGGYAYNGSIDANNDGAIALGYTASGDIHSYGKGSVAMGHAASTRTLEASGNGAIAMGYANTGDTKATANGSVAIGDGVVASASNAFAFGTGITNSTADRFAVGFGETALEVWDANVKVNGHLCVGGSLPSGITVTELGTREVFFSTQQANQLSDYRVSNNGSTGTICTSFMVPPDFNDLVSLEMRGIVTSQVADANRGNGGVNRNIDLYSDYASVDESYTTHSEENTSITYTLENLDDEWFDFNIISVFDGDGDDPGIAAGDVCGLKITHRTIGGYVRYAGIIMKYNTP